MVAYYNEIDDFAADWLENLITEGLIPDGKVDRRSIVEVDPADVAGFDHVHWFAGIGGWPLALRIAGWPDSRSIWTGSCPCQPFSAAGRQKGKADKRHLWPWMRHQIFRGRPPITVGEQVASALGREWLVGVRANMEALGYVFGGADLCSACVGAPNIRQRLFWSGSRFVRSTRLVGPAMARRTEAGSGFVVNARRELIAGRSRISVGLGGSICKGLEGHAGDVDDWSQSGRLIARPDRPIAATGAWDSYDVARCRDSKARRVGRGVQPLAYGIPKGMGQGQPEISNLVRRASANRVGRLKGYGNAINPEVAAVFIRTILDLEQ